MPELPEVESVVRGLAPHLTGQRIARVQILGRSSAGGSPQPLAKACGRGVESISRRAKYILINLTGEYGLTVHLRMTGWLGLKNVETFKREADPYVRIAFELEGGKEWLVFRDVRRFGRIWCGEREELLKLPALAKLGPEPLEIGADEFAARLGAHRGRLKSLLLDQRFLAGLGNIYADEALFAAQLHPERQAQRVKPQAARALHAAIQATLKRSLAAGGSSIDDYLHPDGTPGWFQRELKAYGREGQPCVRCKAAIKRIVLGQRGTWFCPKCQRK